MNPKDPIVLLAQESLKVSDGPGKEPIVRCADAIANLIYSAVMLHKLIMVGLDEQMAKREFMAAINDCYNDIKVDAKLLKSKGMGDLN